MYRFKLEIGLVVVFCCSTSFGQQLSKYEVVEHRVFQSSPEDATSAAEVCIAINPTNKDEMIAGAMITGVFDQSRSNYSMHSIDGGKTWETVSVPKAKGRIQGDDVIVFDRHGNAVHGYMSVIGMRGIEPVQASGIHVITKKFNEEKWSNTVYVVDHPTSTTPLEDKPWLVFDKNEKSKHVGNLYCSWLQCDEYLSTKKGHQTRIRFSRSVDGGKSFETPITISDEGGSCLNDSSTLGSPTPTVDSKGNVFVTWIGARGFVIDVSRDGGKTFGKDLVQADVFPGRLNGVDGVYRHLGFPVSSLDHSNGPFKDRLYINWTDDRHGDKDVFLIYSDDQGNTWSKPKRVNNDKLKNGKQQFFTWMAVDPKDGSINIAFYDRRNTEGTETQLTLARSIDGGKTFKNFHIKNQPNFECTKGVFFGDYLGIDAVDGRVVVSYMNFYRKAGMRRQFLRISTAIFNFVPGKQIVR